MKLKYVGPRPVITPTEIYFKESKEDKYVYVHIAMQLIGALDHEYEEDRRYVYDSSFRRPGDDEIYHFIVSRNPNLEQEIENALAKYSAKLDKERQDAEKSRWGEVEKKSLLNNLDLMREYRLQRAANKIFYEKAVYELADVIIRRNIEMIKLPFFEKFMHVVGTVKGILEARKSPRYADVCFVKEGDKDLKIEVHFRSSLR